MNRDQLLDIHPRELRFRFELYREAYSVIWLTNNSGHYVAFKVSTTGPDKYFGQPGIEVLSPGSSCDVQVRMLAPNKAPPNMHAAQDTFRIKSIVVNRGTTAEDAKRLFTERGRTMAICRLGVFYVPPERLQMMEQNGDVQMMVQNGDWFRKAITIGLIGLIVWYLMLPFIWGLLFTIVVLVTRVANRVVSDSVQDWLVNILVPVVIHFINAFIQHIFRGNRNHS